MAGKIRHNHADHHIAGVEFAGTGARLRAVLGRFDDLFGRHDHFLDEAIVLAGIHHRLNGLLHALLETGVGVHDVPARLLPQFGVLVDNGSVHMCLQDLTQFAARIFDILRQAGDGVGGLFGLGVGLRGFLYHGASHKIKNGRAGGIRTPNLRFWRPPL